MKSRKSGKKKDGGSKKDHKKSKKSKKNKKDKESRRLKKGADTGDDGADLGADVGQKRKRLRKGSSGAAGEKEDDEGFVNAGDDADVQDPVPSKRKKTIEDGEQDNE